MDVLYVREIFSLDKNLKGISVKGKKWFTSFDVTVSSTIKLACSNLALKRVLKESW